MFSFDITGDRRPNKERGSAEDRAVQLSLVRPGRHDLVFCLLHHDCGPCFVHVHDAGDGGRYGDGEGEQNEGVPQVDWGEVASDLDSVVD